MAFNALFSAAGVTGTQTYGAIGFVYLADSHVKVYVNEVETTDFTFSGAQAAASVVINTPTIATGDRIVVRRETPLKDAGRLVDWTAGAAITASDLDTAHLQNLYIAEERADQETIRLGQDELDGTGKWDARSRIIKSVTDGVAANDACTKGQLDLAVIGGGDLPIVGAPDSDSGLFVNSGAWATRTPAQSRAHLGLALLQAGIYTWTPAGGAGSTIPQDATGTWNESNSARLGNGGVPAAPTVVRLNDAGGAVFQVTGDNIRLNDDGEYLLICNINCNNTNNTVHGKLKLAITDELNSGSQTIFYSDQAGSGGVDDVINATGIGVEAGHISKTFFVPITVSGGSQDIAFRAADHETGASVLTWSRPTQIVAVRIS